MSNVVSLFPDFSHCEYFDERGQVGVKLKDSDLAITPMDSSVIKVTLGGLSGAFTRAELAEFLHVAACLLDSEYRYLPDMDMAGMNYEEDKD